MTAGAFGDRVELRVIDHRPGIPEADWERVFLPFQRLGGPGNNAGVGLGLAVSAAWPKRWAAPWNRKRLPAAG